MWIFRGDTRFRYICIIGVMMILWMVIGYFSPESALSYVAPSTRQSRQDAITLSFWYNGSDVIVDVSHYYGFYGSTSERYSSIIYGDAVELEIDGRSQILEYCAFECNGTELANAITNCPVTRVGSAMEYPTVKMSYNLGEITGTPPKIRARTRSLQCTDSGAVYNWYQWSAYYDAIVPNPIPLVEIASVIGIGGIGVAILNNYWSGRREKQMTEVTRTAAVDERFMELYDASRETEFQRTQAEVLYQYEWTDYDDFLAKYGPRANVDAWAKIQSTAQYYEGIGVLVRTDSVSLDQIYQLLGTQIVDVWDKLGDVVLERRKSELNPQIFSAFESLYYAIKNYSQQAPSDTQDDVRVHKFE